MPLDATVLAALLHSCAANVAPATMVAIIQVESEGDPFRIGVNAGGALSRQPGNLADAVATARGLLRKGANFDAGLMQINSANFARLGLTPESVFDPCTNLRAGARVLGDNYGRARDAGHTNPLQAALSEYNTGSRSRGLRNGYVGKVFAAAGGGSVSAPVARPAVVRVTYDTLTPDRVGGLLVSAFGGRITDTLRPMNALYGARNSYHKYGQAVDFVPRAGLHTITREQIRAVMAQHGIRVAELLGPGDRGHADHWHLAFYTGDQTRPLDRAQIVVARAERGVGGLTSAAVQPMASYEAAPAPQARVMAARPNAAPISVAVNFRRDMLHPSPTDPTADPRFIPRTITASN